MVAEGPARLEEAKALEDGLGGGEAGDDGEDARTTGPLRFHRAIREGLAPPACSHIHRPVIHDRRRRDWRRSASK